MISRFDPLATAADLAAMTELDALLTLHFNLSGEIEVIKPASAHIRIKEHAVFASADFAERLHAQSFALIGLRDIRDRKRRRDAWNNASGRTTRKPGLTKCPSRPKHKGDEPCS